MITLDATDKAVINALQGGFPISERPFADAAGPLGIAEDDLIARVARLKENGVLSRFGPLYHAGNMGGALVLAAMRVPAADFETVAGIVNGFPEVAHNYERDHALNMWFVVATETEAAADEVFRRIEAATDLTVLAMPKLKEFFVELKLEA